MKFCSNCAGARMTKIINDGVLGYKCILCSHTERCGPRDTLIMRWDKSSKARYDVALDNATEDAAANWMTIPCVCGAKKTALVIIDTSMKAYLKCGKCGRAVPYRTAVDGAATV